MSNCNNSNQNCGGNNIYVSGAETKKVIEVSNNKSKYYAELAETYKNKAKEYCDTARYYAEQNSDVSMNYIDTLETTLRNLINTKQDAGNYALASAIPTATSDLTNDSGYITSSTLSGYQTVLVSGTSIKTVNNDSLLGSGNIDISMRNIGEIVTSTMPLTDAGLHLLDGTLLSGDGSYAQFVDYIADLYDSGDYSAIFDTEANWQAAVTLSGVCDKFVYDSVNNTVRLPKYGNQIYTALPNTLPVIGNGQALGLTDGTKTVGLVGYNGNYVLNSPNAFGVNLSSTNQYVTTGNVTGGQALGVTSDGSKSGIIADLSNLSTSLDCYYYIVVATTTKTSIEVDIDEIATDLNGKADVDLTNVNTTGTSKVAGWSMPSSTYDTLTLGASGSTYTAPANGYFRLGGKASANYQYVSLAGSTLNEMSNAGNGQTAYIFLPVLKNEIVTATYTTTADNSLIFVYAKGSESEA